MALFTVATAREMAARSQETRRRNAAKRLALATLSPQSTTQLADPNPKALLSCTRLQLDALDARLGRERLTPEEWDRLTRAKERLWKIYAHAAGIPGPGHLRPARQRERPAIYLDPVPIEPQDTNSGNGNGATAYDAGAEPATLQQTGEQPGGDDLDRF